MAFCFIFCLCFCLLIVCFCIHSIILSLGSMILLSVRLYANICVLYLHLFLVCSCVLSFVCFLSWGWCLSVCLLFVRSTVCSLVTSFVCLPTPFCFFMVYLSEILVGPFVDLFIPRFISFRTQTFLVIHIWTRAFLLNFPHPRVYWENKDDVTFLICVTIWETKMADSSALAKRCWVQDGGKSLFLIGHESANLWHFEYAF